MTQRKVLTVTIKDEPVFGSETGETQLRVVIETEGCSYDKGIDFDDGYPQAADDIQDTVMGQITRQVNWEEELKKLYA